MPPPLPARQGAAVHQAGGYAAGATGSTIHNIRSYLVYAFDVATRQQLWDVRLPYLKPNDIPPTGLSGVGMTLAVQGDDVVVGGRRRKRRRVLGYRLDGATGEIKAALRGKGERPDEVAVSERVIVTGTDGPGGVEGRVNIYRRRTRRPKRVSSLFFLDDGRAGRAVAAVGETVIIAAPEHGAVFGYAPR